MSDLFLTIKDGELQAIIQKKSASGSRTLPFVIFDKKSALISKIVLF